MSGNDKHDMHKIILKMTGTLGCYNNVHQYLQLKGIDTQFLGYLSTMYHPDKDEAIRQWFPENSLINLATGYMKTASCVAFHTLLPRND